MLSQSDNHTSTRAGLRLVLLVESTGHRVLKGGGAGWGAAAAAALSPVSRLPRIGCPRGQTEGTVDRAHENAVVIAFYVEIYGWTTKARRREAVA